MTDKEIWKPIPDYPGYEVSNLGRVRSLDRYVNIKGGKKRLSKGKILKFSKDTNGYPQLTLYKSGIKRSFKIHQLVAVAFIPNPNKKPEINHINGLKDDFKATNLEWSTRSENEQHAYDMNLAPKGAKSPFSKLTDEEVSQIRNEYVYNDPAHSTNALAKKYKVSQGVIWRIVQNKTYHKINYSPRYPSTPNKKLSEELVKKLRDEYIPNNNEYGITGLSQKYNIPLTTVWAVIKNKSYRDDSYSTCCSIRKLSDEQVKQIRKEYIPGDKNFGIRPLSRKYNISRVSIRGIVNYKTYKNVK